MTIDHDLPPTDILRRPATELIDPTNKDRFDKWLRTRQRYVEAQGWHYGDDHDRYDDDPRTLHVVKERESSGDIMVGLRLTPCDTPEESLSWHMMTPHMQEQIRANLPAEGMDNLWDLTRLVPGELTKDEATDAILEAFGAGMAASGERSPRGNPPRWIFATTPAFVAFFNRQGIEFHELARGKNNPNDKKDTVFCYADPIEEANRLRSEGRLSYNAVLQGIEAVHQVL